MSLLPVEEAQARLLALASPLPVEDAPLANACGRWTARDVSALRSQPAANLSAMDGYAIAHADLPGPWQIAGTSAAGGDRPAAITQGQATRIFTGAPLPDGADTVIIQEDVSASDGILTLNTNGPASAGKHVRALGSDFADGQVIIPAATRLNPAHVALAALAGYGSLPVHRLPRIALLSTGSELVEPGAPVGEGQLPASNAVMLRAMLGSLPCKVDDLGLLSDDLESITTTLRDASAYDIIVSTGGASVGDHDLVKPALVAAGGEVDFWKIRMRPGKPLICGTLGNSIFLGLPGNPVSAYVTAMLFLLPLVRHRGGSRFPLPIQQDALSGADLPPTAGRDDFLRGTLCDGVATPVYHQDSAATYALSLANCLIHRRARSPAAMAGTNLTVLPFPA
jgi:molybdopterin molybdotransferase